MADRVAAGLGQGRPVPSCPCSRWRGPRRAEVPVARLGALARVHSEDTAGTKAVAEEAEGCVVAVSARAHHG